MEAESVSSLSPLLQGVDQWGEVLLLLPLLLALEAVLSADNAIALAAISRRLHNPARQQQALNIGLLLALIFRLLLIVAARWVLQLWPLQLLAAGYLLVLCIRHLLGADEPAPAEAPAASTPPETTSSPEAAGADAGPTPGEASAVRPAEAAPSPGWRSLGGVVITLALTDLAFSLDSVAAAVAVTDRLVLVMAGGVIGVIALRLTAALFIRWLEIFRHLETAGYLAVGLVGIRLVLRVALPWLVLPEWSLLLLVALLFLWGFSVRDGAAPESPAPDASGS
ncbi:MAG: hypothetical protein VKK62_06845 [Synechococcaceae cyanobacterium]|nr:hypothetical protein [Synechococcaceae cyanobacterium]